MPVIEGGVLNQLFRPVQPQPEPDLRLVLLERPCNLRRLCAPNGSQAKIPASAVLLRDLELQPSLVCQRFDNRIDGLLGDHKPLADVFLEHRAVSLDNRKDHQQFMKGHSPLPGPGFIELVGFNPQGIILSTELMQLIHRPSPYN